MKIFFNQSEFDLKGSTIEDLLNETRSDKEQGFVVAVNNKIILKKYWESHHLDEADIVLTILPVHGG
jgi:thiamine biosynthesis protein ThiS